MGINLYDPKFHALQLSGIQFLLLENRQKY